jgi:FtsP/CotA-like multicopper oxidase with cupredoxin domain
MFRRSTSVIFVLVLSLVLFLAVSTTVLAQYYTYPPTPPPSATPKVTSSPTPVATSSGTNLVLYEGPLTSGASSNTLYGFGDTPDNITSPGPTLSLQEGTTYVMTVYNVDPSLAHSWEIVSTKAISSSPLFGAGIEITNFIPSGSSASVTFTASQAGNFYYVCTRPGHIELGMWGNVEVSSAVPEFVSPAAVFFIMLTIAVASVALMHQRRTVGQIR